MTPDLPEARSSRRSHEVRAGSYLVVILALSAIAALAAPGHPTGHPVIDAVYRAAFAAGVAAAAGKASRGAILLLATVGLAGSRGWWIAPAAVTSLAAFGATFGPRPLRRLSPAIGAVGAQVLLHLHATAFHGSTALLAGAAVAPAAVSAYRASGPRARSIVRQAAIGAATLAVLCTIPLVVAVVTARHDLSAGVQDTRAAFDAASNADQPETVAAIAQARGAFARARHTVSNPLTALADLVPIVSQHRQAIGEAASVAVQVTGAADRTARMADYGQLRYQGGRLDVSRLAAMAQPLAQLRDTLTAARHRTNGVSDAWLLAPATRRLHDLERELDRALPDARLAAQAADAAPDLLGANGPRHYLVAFMTPAEQRGLGGFIGAWGEITADNGHLRLIRSGPGSDWFKPPPNGRTLAGSPEYLARYSAFGVADSPADAFYSPDFPMDAEVLANLYPQAGGERVDGVLALDPQALAALVSLTGPIKVEGRAEPLTAANLADFLLRDQYVELPGATVGPPSRNPQAARKDFLQVVLRTTFDRLTTGSLPGPRSLADHLSPAMHQGRLLFWSRHAPDQSLAEAVGLAGRFPTRVGSDVLAVTTQNEGHNKIDYYLHRSIRYSVRIDPSTGATNATATVTLRNDASATGLPNYVIGNAFGLPWGTNATYVSLYSALDLEGVTLDGTPTTASAAFEAGARAFGVAVKIPPGGTRTLVFRLRGTVGTHPTYRLVLRPQPMVQPDHVDIQVELTPGWRTRDTTRLSTTLLTTRTFTIDARRG